MNYVELTRYGTPWEVCRTVDGPALGDPGPGEVKLNVEAGPINPAELLLIEGKYASKPPLPARLGIEGVGTITAVGDGVTKLAVGDRVMSLGRTNWAEEIQVPANAVVKVTKAADKHQLSMLKVKPIPRCLCLNAMLHFSLMTGSFRMRPIQPWCTVSSSWCTSRVLKR